MNQIQQLRLWFVFRYLAKLFTFYAVFLLGMSSGTAQYTCEDIYVTTANGNITIDGLNSPISISKIFDSSWNIVYECSGPCESSNVVPLSEGTYFVQASLYTADWQFICSVANYYTVSSCTDLDNDGICADVDCNDLDPFLPTTPGTLCNDGDPNTFNDIIQNDGCTCAGTPATGCSVATGDCSITISGIIASDNAKVFNSSWQVIWECNPWISGMTCSTAETIPNLSSGVYWVQACGSTTQYTVSCGGGGGGPCDNAGGDLDNDGICADVDCNDLDPFLPTSPGTLCNDGDPNTSNDVIQNDGCTCAGTPATGCSVATGDCSITISGLNAFDNAKVFNSNWQIIFECNPWTSGMTCNATEVVPNLSGGVYGVQACGSTTQYTVSCGGGGPCDNAGGDLDNDGVCADVDCNDLDPSLPTTPGTLCNDGDPNTSNDIIQNDGCTCAGSTTSSCAFSNFRSITGHCNNLSVSDRGSWGGRQQSSEQVTSCFLRFTR